MAKKSKNLESYKFPVYATQGGGYAREIKGTFIFVEAPEECMGLDIGDEVPKEWGCEPANQLARNQVRRCQEEYTLSELDKLWAMRAID